MISRTSIVSSDAINVVRISGSKRDWECMSIPLTFRCTDVREFNLGSVQMSIENISRFKKNIYIYIYKRKYIRMYEASA